MTYNEILNENYISSNNENLSPTKSWVSNFEELRSFLSQRNWSNLTPGDSLYAWCSQQRKRFNNQTLTDFEFKSLVSIKFVWDLPMLKWDQSYEGLKKYYQLNNGEEPWYDRGNPESEVSKLSIFVQQARSHYKKGELAPYEYKHKKLTSLIDFSFNGRDKTWFKHAERVKLKMQNKPFDSLLKLLGASDYTWLLNQHNKVSKENQGEFDSEKIAFLTGLELDKYFVPFSVVFAEIEKIVKEHGKLQLNKLDKQYQSWLQSQRAVYRNGNLTPSEEENLRNIGFDLSGKKKKLNEDDKWRAHYDNYLNFVKEYGKEPTGNTDKHLYFWAQANRQVQAGTAKNRKQLEPWKIKLLNDVGFNWRRKDVLDKKWDESFNDLCIFLSTNTLNTLVGQSNKNAKTLYTWVRNQKVKYNYGKLVPKYQLKLESVGFDLDKSSVKQILSSFHPGTELSIDFFRNRLRKLNVTERETISSIRLEHYLQKKILFNTTPEMKCAICGKLYPTKFLVVAHIKRRSKCTNYEKLNENIVMPACTFGCDILYEKGLIGVKEGLIVALKDVNNEFVSVYLNDIVGKRCLFFNELNREFFKFHLSIHTNKHAVGERAMV